MSKEGWMKILEDYSEQPIRYSPGKERESGPRRNGAEKRTPVEMPFLLCPGGSRMAFTRDLQEGHESGWLPSPRLK